MYDFFSEYSSIENPTFETVVFTVLFAFLLSVVIGFTYENTSGPGRQGGNFVQSLVLSSIVAASIVQAIGDSVATGLGMLAALAIIRFRTTFQDPRDIIFMFAALGAGIGCGVYGYTIALTGTLGFCMAAFILRFTPFYEDVQVKWQLRFRTAPGTNLAVEAEEVLARFCREYNMKALRKVESEIKGEQLEYEYQLVLKPRSREDRLIDALSAIEQLEVTRLMIREGL